MHYEIYKSFIRDSKKAPIHIQKQLKVVLQDIGKAEKLVEIKRLKKLSGAKNAYRIRIDDFRLGFYLDNNTIFLSRLLSRKDIYKYFPQK